MTEQPSLDARPASLTVAGRDTVAIVNAIKQRGGHVAGMRQYGQRNGVWKLRIEWPDERSVLGVPIPIE